MARTFLSQPNQIFNSENYNDALTTGVTLQVSASSLQDDLNSIRTQLRQVIWAGVSGSWYDAITAPSGSNSARGLNTINIDVSDLEQKRLLFRKNNINVVNVNSGSNFALLSAALGTTPENFAVVDHPLLPMSNATGSLVALLSGSEGTYGTHSMALISGSSLNILSAKNLCIIRDAQSGLRIMGSANSNVIYGLLQVESGTLTGDAFNDTDRRSQISFVEEIILNNTSSLRPVSSSYIGGQSITYSYIGRTALDNIPEDAYVDYFCDNKTIFYQNLLTRNAELRGSAGTEILFGTNFDVRVVNIPVNSSVTWQMPVHGYTSGKPIYVRITWATSGTTGTVKWRIQLAAISSGDAQSVTTKAFGTIVDAEHEPVNGTANGIRVTIIKIASSAELDNLANNDILFVKLVDAATTGTPGTIRCFGIELFS